MKKQIEAEIERLSKMLGTAEEKSESENEATATRYEGVVEALQEAIDVLEQIDWT